MRPYSTTNMLEWAPCKCVCVCVCLCLCEGVGRIFHDIQHTHRKFASTDPSTELARTLRWPSGMTMPLLPQTVGSHWWTHVLAPLESVKKRPPSLHLLFICQINWLTMKGHGMGSQEHVYWCSKLFQPENVAKRYKTKSRNNERDIQYKLIAMST